MTFKVSDCPPESGGQRHRVLCDDARGGSINEMLQNAFRKRAALEPPPARSRLLSRSCCPPDSGGQFFGWLQHLQCLVVGSTILVKTILDNCASSGGAIPVSTPKFRCTRTSTRHYNRWVLNED